MCFPAADGGEKMSRDDTSYYRQRAVTERAMALSSERENVREIHEELARLYDALAQQSELRPVLAVPADGSGTSASG